ncbi:MAG: DUF2791 family P-loop domain-containing protein [Planctomycetes bacterium]|nr:DUF2791 family P-loop domain-containing protein [Planctomycetota bacterium]
MPSEPPSVSGEEVQAALTATAITSSRDHAIDQSAPSTPDEVAGTDPSLWVQLEEWIQNDVKLDDRHVVFCRRVFISRLSGNRLSPAEAQDAGRLLTYAMKRGFRPQHDVGIERTRSAMAPLDNESVSRVRAATWSALSDWTTKVDLFKPEVRQFCKTLATLKEKGEELPNKHYETAAKILNRSLELGFSREHVCFEDNAVPRSGNGKADGGADKPTSSTVVSTAASVTRVASNHLDTADPRLLRRAIQSLRTGLPPTCMSERPLTVGFDQISKMTNHFLRETEEHGSSIVIRGDYGQGKTFTLGLVEELALEQGFAVARTEIDAEENKLDKPQHIYRSLLNSLRLPGTNAVGGRVLAEAAFQAVRKVAEHESNVWRQATARRTWLNEHLGCEPLAWLFSDPQFLNKPKLVAVLSGEKRGTVGEARAAHVLPGSARDWPTFFAGTQGDVGSYLLAGVGRLCRLLGFKGLVLILDEMEKWQDLNWKAQSRAGNLLGGLIWGATARDGERECRKSATDFYWQGSVWKNCDHTDSLEHSGWCGGFPFTTSQSCHVGVAIAMTPRGGEGPELEWQNFGSLDFFDLPKFGKRALRDCFQKTASFYTQAYEVDSSVPVDVFEVAYAQWRDSGDLSARNGVISVIAALDDWRGNGSRQ